jgi:hypothetical protein
LFPKGISWSESDGRGVLSKRAAVHSAKLCGMQVLEIDV